METQTQTKLAKPPLPSVLATVTKDDPIAYLLTRKGQIVTITSRRDCKLRKGVTVRIEKLSTFQAQVGVDYDKKSAVIAKRETGELPESNGGLPWGEWEIFPYVIRHNGKRYFRFYTVKSSMQRTAEFFMDGKPVEKETIREFCLASEFREQDGDCFTFCMDGEISVH